MQEASTVVDRAVPPAAVRPDARFMLAHPAHVIALGFGSGLSPVAPGTCGTLWAWLGFLAMQIWLGPAAIGAVIACTLPIAWWAGMVTARHLGVADPSNIVADEILCFWIILWFVMPAGWLGQAVAFVLFRILDAWKPGPVAWADRTFKGFGWRGGFGILADDLVAAFCTLLLIAAWRQFA